MHRRYDNDKELPLSNLDHQFPDGGRAQLTVIRRIPDRSQCRSAQPGPIIYTPDQGVRVVQDF
jgi:hypothetical protein